MKPKNGNVLSAVASRPSADTDGEKPVLDLTGSCHGFAEASCAESGAMCRYNHISTARSLEPGGHLAGIAGDISFKS